MPLDRITFVTGNAGKLAEVQAILGQYIEVDNHGLDLEEIQGTIEEVSSAKCKKAAEAVSSLIPDCYYIEFHVQQNSNLEYFEGFSGERIDWFCGTGCFPVGF